MAGEERTRSAPEGKMWARIAGNPDKPQRKDTWVLVDAPPPEPDFLVPPELDGVPLSTERPVTQQPVSGNSNNRWYPTFIEMSQTKGDKES